MDREPSVKSGIEQNHKIPLEDESPLLLAKKEDHIISRRQNKLCRHNDIQYILFLLDTSGSIGSYNFSRITETIGNISAHFCSQVQVAVMTFNHHFHLEFCFNCYDNDPIGRRSLSQAIKNIQYREGLSYAAGAARCACVDLLHESCGLPQDAECLDIVLITDGYPNDPFLNICKEIQCLHNRSLNTYALGIGSFNEEKIQCIQNSNEFSIFQFGDLDELERVFEDIIAILRLSSGVYTCIDHSGFLDDSR